MACRSYSGVRESSMPAAVNPPVRADAAPPERPGAPAPHVLIADDPRTSGALAWLLREQGYQVTSVSEQRRLIDSLERTRPDLVLVDVEHLGAEGEEVLERLKRDERWRDVP